MNELALFAGAGGGILGGHLLGWRTVCAVEWEAYPASVLVARQNDKILPPFPIWDDVQTFDGKLWQGIVDVVSGGFPCQDISIAGKGDGLEGERSGMWKQMARIIGEVRPQYAFVENSPMLTSRGLGTVLRDLAQLGYDAEWGVLGADDVGANHRRKRIWIIAKDTKQSRFFSHSKHNRIGWGKQQSEGIEEKTRSMANSNSIGHLHREFKIKPTERGIDALSNFTPSSSEVSNSSSKDVERYELSSGTSERFSAISSNSWWSIEPHVGRVANGVAARVDRLKAIGNGQVPLCAATAWNILKGRIDD